MAQCDKCGKELDEGDAFCHACGAPAAGSGAAAARETDAAAATAAPARPAPPYGGRPSGESPREIAERRVSQKLELWWHLGSYLIINLFLVIIWAITGRGYPWFVWVMIGWGVGVVFHLMHYLINVSGEPRRERLIQRELERLRGGEGPAGEPPGEG